MLCQVLTLSEYNISNCVYFINLAKIKLQKKKTKRFIDEVFQYGVNEAKWKAAFEFCIDRNMKFLVLTEKDLGLSK